MDPVLFGVLGCILVVVLLLLGMPIAFLMMFVGFFGICVLSSFEAALGVLGRTIYEVASHYPYTIIPLFVLMGSFATQAGITAELYDAFDKWLRRLPGGLGIATIGACAGFAAVSGSSVAATAAMGNIALPQMRRFNYHPRLATGVIAAGGTLSFLIPPSLGFVIYGMLTEQSIGKLLVSGILPGMFLALSYMLVVFVQVKINPSLAPKILESVPLGEKIKALKGVWEALLVFFIVMGGIYFGFINPTEAGGLGAFALFVLTLIKRKLTFKGLFTALLEMARISTFVLFLVAGATIFSYFLALSTIPSIVSEWIGSLPLSRYLILIIVILIYLLLGCFLDAVSMMVLTLPVIFPVIVALKFDPIWFGVVAVLMMEAGLITPPVGLNVYTLAGMVKDVPMFEIFKGAAPFLFSIFIVVALVILFPQIALFLPTLMGR
ncbi:MAG: TRAP transporter large permease [Desulfobacterota bacterium]|nr:TRAP transporter large permease [Thermodesulfobacteriota bacterium]MDW8002517.1 TRAP transporter large permease [Deltaproteobacteria bacterium]